jgi:SAM-dependent methyltransferase
MRELELGQPIDFGASGVAKRLEAFSKISKFSGVHLLDVGCGNGAYTVAMAELFSHVEAVDIEPTRVEDLQVRIAAQRLDDRIRVQAMSAASLEFPSRSFDAVTAIEVLEHLPALDRSLEEMRRVMKDDGRLFVTVPNRLFPLETHSVSVLGKRFPGKRIPLLPYFPVLHSRWSEARSFTLRSLVSVVHSAGFRPIGHGHVMPPFDRWLAGGKYVKPITERLEATPARIFGVSLVLVCEKDEGTTRR